MIEPVRHGVGEAKGPVKNVDVVLEYKVDERAEPDNVYYVHVQAHGPISHILQGLREEFEEAYKVSETYLKQFVTEAKDDGKRVVTESRPDGENNTGSGINVEGRDNPNPMEDRREGSGDATPVDQ